MNDLVAGAIGERSLSKPAPMVRLSHVARNYQRGIVPTVSDFSPRHVQGLSLLRPGAFDKTTTLRVIADLEAMNEGALYFKDRLIVHTSQNNPLGSLGASPLNVGTDPVKLKGEEENA